MLVGAGDIARCNGDGDEATAQLLDTVEGTVFTTGDNAYPVGSEEDFERCYDASWGRHLARTALPVPGNHDWDTPRAAGYLGYFGEAAAPEGTTWYARTEGEWRVIVLDTACTEVGGCGEESPQLTWLRDELAANPHECTLALWHEPRFSSGWHGSETGSQPFWDVLHAAGAELVVNGHEHAYERFAPLNPSGTPDPERGLRQLIVGTGGGDLRDFDDPLPGSEVRIAGTFGVLRLELRPGSYRWDFLPVSGSTTDTGTGDCHAAPDG